jgi:hypothetical protein
LARRGLAPAALAFWAETAREASATTPAALIRRTARFVTSSPAAGVVPAAVAPLVEGVIQMMWLARLKPLGAVAAALVLATAGVGVLGQQQPTPKRAGAQSKTVVPSTTRAGGDAAPDVPANRALARNQLALIDEAEALLRRRAEAGEILFSDPVFSLWGRRRLESLRISGAEKAEIVAALEKYADRIKTDEAIAQKLHEAGRLARVDLYDVNFRRLEAEIWLNQEKAR